jgi:hypothetical protein
MLRIEVPGTHKACVLIQQYNPVSMPDRMPVLDFRKCDTASGCLLLVFDSVGLRLRLSLQWMGSSAVQTRLS